MVAARRSTVQRFGIAAVTSASVGMTSRSRSTAEVREGPPSADSDLRGRRARLAARGDQRPRAGRVGRAMRRAARRRARVPALRSDRRDRDLPDRLAERDRDPPPTADDARARDRRWRDHIRRSARPRLRDHHQPRQRLGVALREPPVGRRDPHRPLPTARAVRSRRRYDRLRRRARARRVQVAALRAVGARPQSRVRPGRCTSPSRGRHWHARR